MIVFAAITPHPPFSVPEIGTEEERKAISKTVAAFEELRIALEKAEPDTVILISPHGEMEEYHFVINSDSTLKGGYDDFGLDKVLEFKNDTGIASQISYCCEMIDHFVHMREAPLDYGTLIPLEHLLKNIKPALVHLSFSLLSYEKHYEYGELMSNVLRKSPKRIAVIASGELSHRLSPDSPAGYSPNAKSFDHWIVQHLANNDIDALVGMEKELVDDAAECGLRSILIMLGAIYQENYEFHLLCYESPFGVGYLTAQFI